MRKRTLEKREEEVEGEEEKKEEQQQATDSRRRRCDKDGVQNGRRRGSPAGASADAVSQPSLGLGAVPKPPPVVPSAPKEATLGRRGPGGSSGRLESCRWQRRLLC